MRAAAILLAASLVSTSAVADVWKCKQGDRTIYTDEPCPKTGKLIERSTTTPVARKPVPPQVQQEVIAGPTLTERAAFQAAAPILMPVAPKPPSLEDRLFKLIYPRIGIILTLILAAIFWVWYFKRRRAAKATSPTT